MARRELPGTDIMNLANDRFLPPAWVMVLLGACGVVWLLSELREMLVLMIISYALAYVIDPLVTRLEKEGVSRSVGVIGILTVFALLVVVLFFTAVPTIGSEITTLSNNLPTYMETLRTRWQPQLAAVADYLPADLRTVVMGESIEPALNYLNGGVLQKIAAALGAALLQGYSLTLTALNLVLLPFLVYYLSVDFHTLHRSALELFPILQRRQVADIVEEMDRYVSAFVRGQIMVCAILFVLYAIGLKIIGVQLWFLLSIIAGFGNMIPYIGTLMGIVLSSLMALLTFGELGPVVKVLIVFGVVQFAEGMFITPRVMGKNVGMSPLTVILAIFIGGKLFGLLGIFLAIPGAAVLKVLARHLHSKVIHAVA